MRKLTALAFFFGLLLFSAAVFTVSTSFPDEMIEPKWYAAGAAAVVGGTALAALRIARPKAARFAPLWTGFGAACVAVSAAQAAFFVLQECGAVEAYGRFTAGSLDNVAGLPSCLGLSLPVGMEWLRGGDRLRRAAVAAGKGFCVAAILLSGSRTGLLCVAVWAVAELPCGRRAKAVAGAAVVAAGLVLALAVKADSSRGRLFIAIRTAEIVAEKPIMGHGPGGFRARYMDAQADWLERHPDSPCATLADNVAHPLCEWLLVAADYGLAGVCAALALVALTVRHARRHPSAEGREGLRVLACAGVFSLFSYPLLYPFTWIMLAAAVAAVFRSVLAAHSRTAAVAALAVLPLCGFALYRSGATAMELRRVQDKAMLGLSERMMPRYARLYPRLKNDSRFLYNYAAEQYEAGRYEAALATVRECRRRLADYNLCLLEGDVLEALRRYAEAEAGYRRAHWMCPSRFAPLYALFNTSVERGDTAAARRIGREILAKPVKVRSAETVEIIEDVRRRMAGQ